MPVEIVTAPGHDRERSLGDLAVAWMEWFCLYGPGDIQGTPLRLGLPGAIPLADELARLTVDVYALDREGQRLYDSAFYSRPKGADKSGHAARIALFEALGPCRFAGWAEGGEVFEWMDFRYEYRAGEPMGRLVTSPFLRILATEEGQTGNVYDTIYENCRDGPLREAFGHQDDVGITRIHLPAGGRSEIRPSTASSSAKDGGLETWTNFDEALALDTPLPTPTGWTTMGDVEVGALLLGADGAPVTVVKATDVMRDRDCYRVTFADGSSIIASAGHLWMTRESQSSALPAVRTTSQMAQSGRRYRIPASRALMAGTQARWTTITSIEQVESVPVRCVGVDSDDHLFLAGPGGMVTHNTHLYVQPELRRMYDTVRRNMTKRLESEPWSFETSTMYAPGANSVAERSHVEAQRIRDGKSRRERLYFNHRQAWPGTNIADEASLRAGLIEAYGDAASYTDIDRKVAEAWDSRNDPDDFRRYMLNFVTAFHDAWITPQEWDSLERPGYVPADGALITLGLDGSQSDDHTALLGCEVETGLLWPVGIWDPAEYGGELPRDLVREAVAGAFEQYDVVGFYSDVHPLESLVDEFELIYGEKLCVNSTGRHPIQWDMRAKRTDGDDSAIGGREAVVQAVESFHAAIVESARLVAAAEDAPALIESGTLPVTHSGDRRMRQHFVNARRRPVGRRVTIGKEFQGSPNKIDSAAAGMLARQCRQDYLALPDSKRRGSSRAQIFVV